MTQNDSTTILQNENKSLFHKNHIITKNGYKIDSGLVDSLYIYHIIQPN